MLKCVNELKQAYNRWKLSEKQEVFRSQQTAMKCRQGAMAKQNFSSVVFIVLHKVVLTFDSMDTWQILRYYPSNMERFCMPFISVLHDIKFRVFLLFFFLLLLLVLISSLGAGVKSMLLTLFALNSWRSRETGFLSESKKKFTELHISLLKS